MDRTIAIRLIYFNLMLASFLLLDVWIPGSESAVKELSSFYSTTTNSGTTYKPIMETNGVLELVDVERFRLGKLPEKEYKKGQKIKIVKTVITKNCNEVLLWDNGWKQINVGVFSNFIPSLLLVLSILISSVNIFYSNKIWNGALIGAMMYLAIISIVYICCY